MRILSNSEKTYVLNNDLQVGNSILEYNKMGYLVSKAKMNQMSYSKLVNLPMHLQLQILSEMPDDDLINLCSSNKYWRNICLSNDAVFIWKDRIKSNSYLRNKQLTPIQQMIDEPLQKINEKLGINYDNWYQIFLDHRKIQDAKKTILTLLINHDNLLSHTERLDNFINILNVIIRNKNFYIGVYNNFLQSIDQKIKQAYNHDDTPEKYKIILKDKYKQIFNKDIK
jgi:hypothetical protein